MLSVPPMTRRVDFLGQYNCDWVSQSCVRKMETPDSCTQCNRPVHFECQSSWERNADLSHEKKCTSQACREHHPEYQHWWGLHRKPVAVHEKEARAKEALKSFVWAREREHKGAIYHQCQLLDRIAEKGQVWVKWTLTGNIMCIPKSNIEEPTQGRERNHSVVTNVEKNPKKQQKEIATGDAKFPDLLLTDTPPTPPYSRKTRSSGAKGDDGKSVQPGLQTVSRQLKMKKAVQASKPNATTNTKRAVQASKPNAATNTKRTVQSSKTNATTNMKRGKKKVNVDEEAEETMMSEVLEGTADIDVSQDTREIGPVNSATVEVTAETVEVTVDDVNAEVRGSSPEIPSKVTDY